MMKLKTVAMVAFMILLGVGVTQAVDTALTTSGDWSTGGNWSAGEPTRADFATVGDGLTVNVSAAGEVAKKLTLGNASGLGTLDMASGSLTVSNLYVGAASGGQVLQSDGALAVEATANTAFGMAELAGETATYTMTGGTFSFNDRKGDNLYPKIGGLGAATINLSGNSNMYFEERPDLAVGAGSRAVMNISGTATFKANTDSAAGHGCGVYGYFELNLNGGKFEAMNAQLARYSSATGIVNLASGELKWNILYPGTGQVAINVSGGFFNVGNYTPATGNHTVLNIIGKTATLTVGYDFYLKAGHELRVQLDSGISEIYCSRNATDRTFNLAGTLRVGLKPGAAVPTGGAFRILRTKLKTFTGQTFSNVIWEDGLQGSVFYDYANREIWLMNVAAKPSGTVVLIR